LYNSKEIQAPCDPGVLGCVKFALCSGSEFTCVVEHN